MKIYYRESWAPVMGSEKDYNKKWITLTVEELRETQKEIEKKSLSAVAKYLGELYGECFEFRVGKGGKIYPN